MTILKEYITGSIKDIMADMDLYKNDPTALARVYLTHVEQLTLGAAGIVDPTNPVTMVLEQAATGDALAINESVYHLRKTYSELATSFDDLYLHMSDKDKADLFSLPAVTDIKFMVLMSSLNNSWVEDTVDGCLRVDIARNFKVLVSGYIFTSEYPISIKKYPNGDVQISYLVDKLSPLQNVTDVVIKSTKLLDMEQQEWIMFEVEMQQKDVDTGYHTFHSSEFFKVSIPYQDKYYHARVHYLYGDKWYELKTSYTDYIYDPDVPTAVLKVTPTDLTVVIPSIYSEKGLVNGQVRVDLYTTKGLVNVDLNAYLVDEFSFINHAIDEAADVSAYTNAFNQVSFKVLSNKRLQGGRDPLSYSQLKSRLQNNSLGDLHIPISDAQLNSAALNSGFDISIDTDVITNRVYLASRRLPQPSYPELITPASYSMQTLSVTLDSLLATEVVYSNGNRVTIPGKHLFRTINGILSPLTKDEIENVFVPENPDFVETVNTDNLYYNPYYYVIDTSGEEVRSRAYELDNPAILAKSFKYQRANESIKVSAGIYAIETTKTSYRLVIKTLSTDTYKEVDDANKSVVLLFVSGKDKVRHQLQGTNIGKDTDGEDLFEFRINTKFDIGSNDRLRLNMFNFEGMLTDIDVGLTDEFSIAYLVTNGVPTYDYYDSIVSKDYLPSNSYVVSEESMTVKFGVAMSNLWSRARTVVDYSSYQTYDTDELAIYTEDKYELDPCTGSFFRFTEEGGIEKTSLLQAAGSPVLDEDGQQVYLHRAGDVKTDVNDKPLLKPDGGLTRELDLLLIDGMYSLASDIIHSSYRKEVREIINNWILKDLAALQKDALEQTNIFFYPKKQAGYVKAKLDDDTEVFVFAEQSFIVNLFVSKEVIESQSTRDKIEIGVVKALNVALRERRVVLNDLINLVRDSTAGIASFVTISGLGGSANYPALTMLDNLTQLSLGKRLFLQPDGTTIVKEKIFINFVKYTQV